MLASDRPSFAAAHTLLAASCALKDGASLTQVRTRGTATLASDRPKVAAAHTQLAAS